ncbi:hypothetical protein AVEN_79586-1 [Araneus ventricosus]|uniref:Uncharacterized protein n=1 Tax=Araneus ventricosus TaxID=182803 RepID=A0A4Y2LK60_ARAVE|nr:hypothetical protein AVEN_79586-1 [Araneus ventricosus]
MIKKTGQLGILPGRGRNQIQSSGVEEMVTAVVEASSQSPHGSVSVPFVYRVLDLPYSTVRKTYGGFKISIPTKSSICIYCSTGTQRYLQLLHLSSLLE